MDKASVTSPIDFLKNGFEAVYGEMASIMKKWQRVRNGRRCSCNKKKSTERWKMFLGVDRHRWCLWTFLVLILPCVSSLPVQGQKGGSVTLPCNLRTDLPMVLTFGPKYAYGVHQDAEYKDRVHKSGNCDFILQALKTSDAGTYLLKIGGNGQFISFEVHVKGNLTGRKGEELVFDDLPRDAYIVKHHTDTGSTEVWKRGQDVNRLTDKNGSLAISNLTSSSAGVYSVQNSSEQILVTLTVTVTESDLSTKDEQSTGGSSKTGVGWIAALPFLICLFIGYL